MPGELRCVYSEAMKTGPQPSPPWALGGEGGDPSADGEPGEGVIPAIFETAGGQKRTLQTLSGQHPL